MFLLAAACAGAHAPAPEPLSNRAAAGGKPPVIKPACVPGALPKIAAPAPGRATIFGLVTDDRCAELAGATVVVRTGPSAGIRAEITDEGGTFVFRDLPPGRYVVTVFYLDATLDRGGVVVRADAREYVQLAMPASGSARISIDPLIGAGPAQAPRNLP